MTLTLTRHYFNQICQQVLSAFPAEACGLMTGNADATIAQIWPAPNLLADQPGRFELDPRCRLQAEKFCRANAQVVIGHWHSHPKGSALPSITDREMAFEPHLVWLIVATDGQVITDARAFMPPSVASSDFIPVDLIVVPDA